MAGEQDEKQGATLMILKRIYSLLEVLEEGAEKPKP
jgi:hypothetical protein